MDRVLEIIKLQHICFPFPRKPVFPYPIPPPHKMNIFRGILESVCVSICLSMPICLQNTGCKLLLQFGCYCTEIMMGH